MDSAGVRQTILSARGNLKEKTLLKKFANTVIVLQLSLLSDQAVSAFYIGIYYHFI
jgi:hypothetical protein